MGKEIERKFLVKNNDWKSFVSKGIVIVQGYISTDPERTVRIRRYGEEAFITIKGQKVGIECPEFEYPIPLSDAHDMFENVCTNFIDKVRFKVKIGNLIWEIDEFWGSNKGLLIAEVELPNIHTTIDIIPSWVGEEVSFDYRYSNSMLAMYPYNTWEKK